MTTYDLSNTGLRTFSLRGTESVIPGRKLLAVHVSPWSSYAREFTAVTGVIKLSGIELSRIRNFGQSTNEKMFSVILVRDPDGRLDYRHATDCGILPYVNSDGAKFWNISNFTLDLKMLKRLGIKVSR